LRHGGVEGVVGVQGGERIVANQDRQTKTHYISPTRSFIKTINLSPLVPIARTLPLRPCGPGVTA
jgi:hypothetical protein